MGDAKGSCNVESDGEISDGSRRPRNRRVPTSNETLSSRVSATRMQNSDLTDRVGDQGKSQDLVS